MASTFFRVFVVILFGVSHLMSMHAVPITRTKSMWHGTQAQQISQNTHLVITEGLKEVNLIAGRMELELNDYPGSGANNRHTPKPQLGKGCVDC